MAGRKEATIAEARKYAQLNGDWTDDEGEYLRHPAMVFRDGSLGSKGHIDMAKVDKPEANLVDDIPSPFPDQGKPMEGTDPYILKAGREHWYITKGERVQALAGDTVYLTPEQYAAFQDKFYPANETPPATPLFDGVPVVDSTPPTIKETQEALTVPPVVEAAPAADAEEAKEATDSKPAA